MGLFNFKSKSENQVQMQEKKIFFCPICNTMLSSADEDCKNCKEVQRYLKDLELSKKTNTNENISENKMETFDISNYHLTSSALFKINELINVNKNYFFNRHFKNMIDYENVVSNTITDFYLNIENVNDIDDFYKKYDFNFFKMIYKKNFSDLLDILIKNSYLNSNEYSINFFNSDIDFFFKNMSKLLDCKYYTFITSTSETIKKNIDLQLETYKALIYNHGTKNNYQDVLIFIADLFVTSFIISLIIYYSKIDKEKTKDFYNLYKKISKDNLPGMSEKLMFLYNEKFKDEVKLIPNCASEFKFLFLILYFSIYEDYDSIENDDFKDKVNISYNEAEDLLRNNFVSEINKISKDFINLEEKDFISRVNNILAKYIYKMCPSINDNVFFKLFCNMNNLCVDIIKNFKLEKKNDRLNRYLNGNFDDKPEKKSKLNLNVVKNGQDFELFLNELFSILGYKVKHNGKSGDQGADLILEKNNLKYVVQAKFYSTVLSNTPVQEVTAAIKYYDADRGIVVTNSKFTTGAKNLAISNNIILIDGDKLNDMINEANNRDRDIFDNM